MEPNTAAVRSRRERLPGAPDGSARNAESAAGKRRRGRGAVPAEAEPRGPAASMTKKRRQRISPQRRIHTCVFRGMPSDRRNQGDAPSAECSARFVAFLQRNSGVPRPVTPASAASFAKLPEPIYRMEFMRPMWSTRLAGGERLAKYSGCRRATGDFFHDKAFGRRLGEGNAHFSIVPAAGFRFFHNAAKALHVSPRPDRKRRPFTP